LLLDDAPTMHEAIPGSVDAQEMPDEGRIKGQAGGLQGSLKLAKKYAKVNVEAEVVRRHWRAFWDMRTQPERDTLPGHGAGYRSTITRA
jgi:hypothetical protein